MSINKFTLPINENGRLDYYQRIEIPENPTKFLHLRIKKTGNRLSVAYDFTGDEETNVKPVNKPRHSGSLTKRRERSTSVSRDRQKEAANDSNTPPVEPRSGSISEGSHASGAVAPLPELFANLPLHQPSNAAGTDTGGKSGARAVALQYLSTNAIMSRMYTKKMRSARNVASAHVNKDDSLSLSESDSEGGAQFPPCMVAAIKKQVSQKCISTINQNIGTEPQLDGNGARSDSEEVGLQHPGHSEREFVRAAFS